LSRMHVKLYVYQITGTRYSTPDTRVWDKMMFYKPI
jgi:hypothetical protein